ncbi:MAG: cation transporter [Clostridiales bacterium]|nr:cation transporter [Clostridiales bacterium]
MTGLLLRLFVKDADNTENPAVHTSIGKMAGFTGICCNILLFLGKLLAGLLSGSVSILADAINNLSDAGSSLVTLLGFYLAQRPADKEHPYGHARYEYLSGLVVSTLILVIGLELGKSSFEKVLHPQPILATPVVWGVLTVSLCLKLWMSHFFRTLGARIRSVTLTAASADSRNDVIATAGVLLGYIVSSLFGVNVDGIVGLGIAAFILWSGIGIARDTISPLLGARDPELVKKLSALVLSHEKVLGIHDLLVHDYGPGQCFASVHAELSAEEDPLACHDIIDDIEQDAWERLNVHLVIHYDPVMTNDAEWNRMRTLTEGWVRQVNPRLSIHDFRMVRSTRQTKLVFDLAIPYDMALSAREVQTFIAEQLQKEGRDYQTVIHLDRQM